MAKHAGLSKSTVQKACEFLKFLRLIDRSIGKGKRIHIIVDNYGTYGH